MVQHESEQPAGEEPYEQGSDAPARTVELIAGDYLLTLNPVDGSEIEPCPPGRRPGRPRKRAPEDRPGQSRPGHSLSGAAAVTSGRPPLLEREEERERIGALLAHGRSVRLTGPSGSGRSVLLDAVADDIAELAPDGVVRLNGHRRSADDLLYALFAAVYDAPLVRPDREQLLEALSNVGAVVLLDDLEFGGAALDELLDATPECAYLVAATPEVPAPSPQSRLEEIFLAGLSRTSCVELLEHTVRRQLADDESDWAGDLWFESEGRPQTFVQAGALLRQREPVQPDQAHGALPLPDARGTAYGLAAMLAAGLTAAAQETLRFAVALGGELPHHSHLPALVGDPQADGALGELTASGLASSAGAHRRLAAGVTAELAAAGYGEGAEARVRATAQHYGWWVAHPSVTPERAVAEAETLVAALHGAQRGGRPSAAVLLAHAAAPALAAGLHWGAWERVLRGGQEAARKSGEVAEEAYFHHELGVLALCAGNPERAGTELEASIALRGVLADRRGTVAGRRALALVTDRLLALGGAPPPGGTSNGPGSAPGRTSGNGSANGTGHGAGNGSGAGRHRKGEPVRGPGPGPGPVHVPSPEAVPEGDGTTAPGAVPVPSAVAGPGPEAERGPGAGPSADPESRTDQVPVPPVLPLGGTTSPAESLDTLVSRTPAAGSSASSGRGDGGASTRGLAARNTRRNAFAASAGALLAIVLGTVVTVSTTSDDGKDSSDTVKPDQSSSQPETDAGDDSETPSDTPGKDEPGSRTPSEPGSSEPEAPAPTSESSSPPETSKRPSPSSSSSRPPSTPDDPPSSPDDPPSSPDDPPSTPDDPPSTPDDPPSTPDDPPTSTPEDTAPETSARVADGGSQEPSASAS
ncbi:ATP-binding protein [Streptomyces armeniacus]|nr:ATP-binding protein [Streptomyces armeniacus]